MSDDIVAELDRWIRGSVQSDPHMILQRARDEIVALRELYHTSGIGLADAVHDLQHARDEIVALRYSGLDDADANEALRHVRAEALEKAAQVCERMALCSEGVGQPGFTEAFKDMCGALIDAIRALKD